MTRPAESPVHPLPLPDDCYRTFDRACGSLHPRSECQGEWVDSGCRWRCIPCRRAATTPPPVRVVRLASGGLLQQDALFYAHLAADEGACAVEVMTHAAGHPHSLGAAALHSIRSIATSAAHNARLALGAS